MGTTVPKGHTNQYDPYLREGALLDYMTTQVKLLRLFLSVIVLSYNTPCSKWSEWAIALASLEHQMEARSQSLLLMGKSDIKHTLEARTTCPHNCMACWTVCEEKND